MAPKRPTVIIESCPDYDVERIRRIVGGGLHRLGLSPRGKTLVKPNCVAAGAHFPHAHTRPEFLEGVLQALRDRAAMEGAPAVESWTLGERSGITMPTRFCYSEAGYLPMLERQQVRASYFDEEQQVEIPMYHQSRLRESMFFPEPIATADFFVNCPKFKAHPWTTVTFSLKNYIGIQDDRHRLIDHDHKLDEKVADLQYAIQPQFIAIDAITAGEGRMLTPIPFDMGLVIMGDNQVAFDAVCCHIIGIDPMTVPHIRLCAQRGFGPTALDAIDIVGGVSLDEAKERAKGFEVGLIRVEDYFEGTNIRAYAGPPPGGEEGDYCWGGCPGAMEEAIEILRLFDPLTDEKMPRIHIIFGAYEGPIDAKPGETVVFIGDCATWQGELRGDRVNIDSLYVDRSEKSPHEATADDIFKKVGAMTWKFMGHDEGDVIRLAGCPVSVAENVLALVKLGKLKNPYFDPGQAIPFANAYFSWRTRKALNALQGKAYQRAGATQRGEARPVQNLPPGGVDTPLEYPHTK